MRVPSSGPAVHGGCGGATVARSMGPPSSPCNAWHGRRRRIQAPGNPGRAVWSNRMEGRTGDDASLVDRLRRGEPRAFEELVIAYQHRVFGVALRMLGSRAEADELAQEVFLRAYRAIGAFRGEARLGTWLYGIASRLCLNRLASPDRRLARGDEALADVA